MTLHTFKTIKNPVVFSQSSGNSSPWQMRIQQDKSFFVFPFFFASSIWNLSSQFCHILFYLEQYRCGEITSVYQLSRKIFVSQLKAYHGSVFKSGLKLLQMFSNDRLWCQHKPTSTFVYSIFVFDVAQLRFTVSRAYPGHCGNPQAGRRLLFCWLGGSVSVGLCPLAWVMYREVHSHATEKSDKQEWTNIVVFPSPR